MPQQDVQQTGTNLTILSRRDASWFCAECASNITQEGREK
jgi:hypothetical protein